MTSGCKGHNERVKNRVHAGAKTCKLMQVYREEGIRKKKQTNKIQQQIWLSVLLCLCWFYWKGMRS